MKKNLISFTAGFIACLMLTVCSTTALATASNKSVSVMINDTIRLMLNGKDFTAKETNGTVILPITYNGRTYLPVRALAEALNVPLQYVKETDTIWIGEKNEVVSVDTADQYKDYYGTVITKDANLLTSPGKTFKWGITNDKPLELAYFGCYLVPDAKFSKFTATLYLDPEVKKELVFEIRKDTYDGSVLKSYTLTPGQSVDIDVDITAMTKIYLITNIKMEHDKVTKLIVGEPAFRN